MVSRLLALVTIGWLIAACQGAPPPSQAESAASASAAAQQLDELFETYWQATLQLDPVRATFIGDHRYNDRYAVMIAPAHIAAERALWEQSLAEAEAVDAVLLDNQRQLSRELFIRDLRHELAGLAFPAELMPLNQFRSPANSFAMLGSGSSAQPFATLGDYQNFLGRMDGFVDWVAQAIVNMREGMTRGVVEPALLMERTLPQLSAHIVERAEDSLFWGPLQQFPELVQPGDGGFAGVPAFRRHGGVTAFAEGWGLYSESRLVGEAMGFYEDPYQRFGQLNAELWRAIWLVVDTGLHAKGWDRQQVLDYMYANSATLPTRAVSEAERFMAIPGQALAYKGGQLKILELRRRAEAALGEALDIRDFHEKVLGEGDLPLDVLERRIDAWLAAL